MKKCISIILIGMSILLTTQSIQAYPIFEKKVYYHHYKKVTPHATSSHAPWFIWAVIGCAGGIVTAALIVNATQHRELTATEAHTCGTWAAFAGR